MNKLLFAAISVVAVYIISQNTDLLLYELLSIGLLIYYLLSLIDSIGKAINIYDVTIILALFQCLVMPTIVYHVYDSDYFITKMQYNMDVGSEKYFDFVFPAVVALIIGLKIPLMSDQLVRRRTQKIIDRAKQDLIGRENVGIFLMILGFASGIMLRFVPESFNYIVYLLSKLLYVGVMYIYFSDSPRKKLFLLAGVSLVFLQAIIGGMFGELIYTLILGSFLVLLNSKIRTYVKFSFSFLGLIFILLLQSIKSDYRKVVWYGQGGTDASETGTFFSLLLNKLDQTETFFDKYAMFPTVNRFNQGMIISKVMNYIPSKQKFADGETIYKSIAASFVPRFLWPDKPMSGGHYNMERFTGYKISGVSMNISPMGEAYGNFGVKGGILFMLIYGLFFNAAFYFILNYAKKKATFILWLPVLFLNSIQIETDVLMCVNSLIKNLLFIWFCYWAANKYLRIKL